MNEGIALNIGAFSPTHIAVLPPLVLGDEWKKDFTKVDKNQARRRLVRKRNKSSEQEERISSFGRKFSEMVEGRGGRLEEFRGDTLSDLNSGLSLLASGIKIVSTILTLLGAENNDRNDNFEEAVGSAMDIGATILKVGLEKTLTGIITGSSSTTSSSSTSSSVDKLGVAADTSASLTPQELLHKQQVQAYIAKLSPAQIKLQQQMVKDHVAGEALKKGLNAAQEAIMLAETLEHNGLPQINNPVTNTLANVAGGAGGLLSGLTSVFGGGASGGVGGSSTPQGDDATWVPGLPKPGTLEHTLTLALFKAQQGLNSIMGKDDPISAMLNSITGGSTQPAIDEKLGVAADAVVTEEAQGSGILAAVAALPLSVGSAAVQLVKFVTPTAATGSVAPASGNPTTTYSQVTTGIDPTYAALGVLTTGALGSVLYSYAIADTNFATSATALATGAVAALRRNDVVSAASAALDGALAKISGTQKTKEAVAWPGEVAFYDSGDDDHVYRDSLSDYEEDYGLYDYTYGTDDGHKSYQTQFPEKLGREEGVGEQYLRDPEEDTLMQPYASHWGDFHITSPETGFQGHELGVPARPVSMDIKVVPDHEKETEYQQRFTNQQHDQSNIQNQLNTVAASPTSEPRESQDIILTDFPHEIPESVQFYEPSLEPPSPSVPFVSYKDEHNPWLYLQSGQSTDHLYRGFS